MYLTNLLSILNAVYKCKYHTKVSKNDKSCHICGMRLKGFQLNVKNMGLCPYILKWLLRILNRFSNLRIKAYWVRNTELNSLKGTIPGLQND